MTKKIKVNLEFDVEGVSNAFMSGGLSEEQAVSILKKFDVEELINNILQLHEIEESEDSEDDAVEEEEQVNEEVIDVPEVKKKKVVNKPEEPVVEDIVEDDDDSELNELLD